MTGLIEVVGNQSAIYNNHVLKTNEKALLETIDHKHGSRKTKQIYIAPFERIRLVAIFVFRVDPATIVVRFYASLIQYSVLCMAKNTYV